MPERFTSDTPREGVTSVQRTEARRRSLVGDRDGAIAVEFALFLPILGLMFLGIIQFGGLFFLQNHMAGVAQDTVRRIAVGELTPTTGETYAEETLIDWGVTYSVDASEIDDDILVSISVPLSEASIIDIAGIFGTENLQAAARMRKE